LTAMAIATRTENGLDRLFGGSAGEAAGGMGTRTRAGVG